MVKKGKALTCRKQQHPETWYVQVHTDHTTLHVHSFRNMHSTNNMGTQIGLAKIFNF